MLNRLMGNLRSGKFDKRTLVTYRNIVESILVKGLSVLLSFITVPLTIQYVSLSEFGIWMTITSLVSWFSLVDVSFGNGLRNRLVGFFASNNQPTARQYVSTMYALSTAISAGLILLIVCVHHYANWHSLFNIQTVNPKLINTVITYTLIGFVIQLLLKPINAILLADQRAAFVGWIALFINILTLGCLYGAMELKLPSLLTMAHIYSLIPILVFGLISMFLFSRTYTAIAPRLTDIRRSLTGELLTTGGQFFVLQIISILVFTSGGLFISYFLGSDSVGPYSIVSKYFGVVTILYGIVITPYWSAFTDAYTRQDKSWIHHTMRYLNRVSVLMTGSLILLLLIARPMLRMWVGPEVVISTDLLVWTVLYSTSFIFLSNYNSFVNGVGQIQRLVIFSFIGIGIYIATVAFLFRWVQAGPVSVVIAGTAWNSTLLLVCWTEYHKIIDAMPTVITQPAVNTLAYEQEQSVHSV